MTEVLLLKNASEIQLKTHFVRNYFTKTLAKNIRIALKENKVTVAQLQRKGGKMVLETPEPVKAIKVLQKVFGLHSVSLAERSAGKTLSGITQTCLGYVEDKLVKGDSFALRVKRNGKHSFTSKQMAEQIGKAIQKKIPGLTVNLSNPGKEAFIELDGEELFLYTETFYGTGGLPLGVEGRVGVLMEGKKFDALCAWLMMKRGCNITAVIPKKNAATSMHLNSLKKWNNFRPLKTSKEIPSEGSLVLCLKELNKRTIGQINSYRKKFPELSFFYPLLLYPEKEVKNKLKLVG